jgi:hypothetical protein
MPRHGYFLCFVVLVAVASLTLACGSNPQRQIVSLSVSPLSADGQTQFVAMGSYNAPPMTVTPLQANWAAETEQDGIPTGPTTAVSIDDNGLAQCSTGASGTFAIGAWVLVDPNSPVMCLTIGPFGQPGCNSVLGTAQLTCP